MTATHRRHSTTAKAGHKAETRLYLALELGWKEWKLAFTVGLGQKPRLRTMAARDLERLAAEIAKAKKRFGLSAQAEVFSCYEAGRDGFWLHRAVTKMGLVNQVVDSSSIEVNRRQRRAKTDRLDAGKLVTMLMRYHQGETKVWSVVRVPTEEDEDARQLHRELLALKRERLQHVNEMRGLLATHGLGVKRVDETLADELAALRCWNGRPLPGELVSRLKRTLARWQLVERQIRELETARRQRIAGARPEVPAARKSEKAATGAAAARAFPGEEQVDKVRRLLRLKGVGANGAWLLVYEVFGWRQIKNRRQLAALAGLTPTPYDSGTSRREQGISKAGNPRLRWMLVELAWQWRRWQPGSALTRWYQKRFGGGGPRLRKIGIVALARKLLIAFWKYLECGEAPAGAELRSESRVRVPKPPKPKRRVAAA